MRQSSFRYRKPILKELNYKIKDDFSNDDNAEVSFESNIEVERNENKPIAKVTLSCTIDNDTFPFSIFISMATMVKWENTIDNNSDMVKVILEKSVPALLLSYIRPLVSQITSHSPYRAFDIPFINFLNDDNDNSDE